MMGQRRFVLRFILVVVPLFTAVLWIICGREVFTKSGKVVAVAANNPIFQDMTTEERLVRGPVFGYYIGLDAVLATTVVSLLLAGAWWLVNRWRNRSQTKDAAYLVKVNVTVFGSTERPADPLKADDKPPATNAGFPVQPVQRNPHEPSLFAHQEKSSK